jgi:hypothetical protein
MSHTPKRRLISPSGFFLVLICLLFPFVAVSCQGPGSSVSATYTGMDLVFSGAPDLAGPGGRVIDDSSYNGLAGSSSDKSVLMPPQPLAILMFLAVVLGLALSGVRYPHLRARIGVIASSCGAICLILNQIVIHNAIVDKLTGGNHGTPFGISTPSVDDMVESRTGFWLTLIILLALFIYNQFELSQIRKMHSSGPPITWNPHSGTPTPDS